MLIVPVGIKRSSIEGAGLGCFLRKSATGGIKTGTVIWKFDPAKDTVYTLADLERMREYELEYVLTHCFRSPKSGLWVFPGDKSKWMNFSWNPTTREEPDPDSPEDLLVASRYLYVGTELTVPFSSDLDCNWKMHSPLRKSCQGYFKYLREKPAVYAGKA
jgi:hypothetical protein